jgi:hypothetical protein
MLGIPLDGSAWMFGDNQSVITSSTIPHSNLNKRHNALSYHRVREAISAQILYFIHIDGKLNPSDVMTKFLSWAKFWPLIQPFLFWKGETIKDALPTTPMPQIIAAIKDNKSPSGLRGVTRGNQDEPHGSNVSPSAEINPNLNGEINPNLNGQKVIKKTVTFRQDTKLCDQSGNCVSKYPSKILYPRTDANTDSDISPKMHDDDSQRALQPQPAIYAAYSVTKSLDDDWTVITGRKSTGKLHKDVVCTKPTIALQQVANCTAELYKTSGRS